MLGLDDYGSGSETETETTSQTPKPGPAKPVPSATTSKTKRPPKKITIALPSLPLPSGEGGESYEDDVDRPAAKKQRLENGAGRSSLLSMLPAPKKASTVLSAPQRVLGGGARPSLVFNSTTSIQPEEEPSVSGQIEEGASPKSDVASKPAPGLFVPTSVSRGRANISLEEGPKPTPPKPPIATTQVSKSDPAVDFFSLSTSSKIANAKLAAPSNATISSAPSVSISSAPDVPTFTPPEPTPTDPYPGYYQLPSGAWAAYEPEYYGKFMKKWQDEYNAHVRALEKGQVKGFEGWDRGPVEKVDAAEKMERAKRDIKEREERKALTQSSGSAPAKPRMTMNPSKLSGIARSRHQLSTLLNEAYTNREALEEKIAEGRRNRKEAGNKYGF
ncbi:hypothetical protein AX16_003609 [Volvariella volvacea WC 439]|nr:hypothetical protein AX16_003609 [Volvariella volvacea WC 439]